MIGFTEIVKTVSEVSKSSMYMPKFGEDIKSNSVKDINEADKKLYKNEMEDSKNYFGSKEENNKIGGSYGEVFKKGEGEEKEVHHMPADNVNGLERNDGPAIKMDKEDHRETASCGNSREAREYRGEQKELVEQGKFKEALQMDIDDIRDKFGNKYNDAISEMLEYVDRLEKENKI